MDSEVGKGEGRGDDDNNDDGDCAVDSDDNSDDDGNDNCNEGDGNGGLLTSSWKTFLAIWRVFPHKWRSWHSPPLQCNLWQIGRDNIASQHC